MLNKYRPFLMSGLCVLTLFLSDCSVRCLNGCGADAGDYPKRLALTGCTITDYSVETTVGGAAGFNLIIDSGSTDMAVAGAGCSNCTGLSPLYSETTGTNLNQTITDDYGSGQWTGTIFSDSVALTGMSSITTKFASMTSQSSFFSSSDCNLNTTGINKDQVNSRSRVSESWERPQAVDIIWINCILRNHSFRICSRLNFVKPEATFGLGGMTNRPCPAPFNLRLWWPNSITR